MPLANTTSCGKRAPARFVINPESTTGRRQMDGDADESAGSGRFRLIPVQRIDAPFVASAVPSSSWASMEVDITWAAGSTHTESNNPQGWQFRLSDIGCTGYNQKMTMRYTTGPNRISFEQYGNTSVSRTEPTTTTSEGQAFAFERGDLAIDGVLLSTSANQAVVRLDTITWGGVPVCSTGTYTLNAE